jgi:deoxyadenosine/deoxycytidine kinase
MVIEGPIGVGKTSLATLLSQKLNGRVILEAVEENPFLSSFYDDRRQYAFQTQLFFLLSRFKQQQELFQQDLFNSSTVSDYLFAKDRIFACLNLDPNELSLYDRIFEALGSRISRPDLVIYLQARVEVLLSRIRRRGRDFERKIDSAYLEELTKAYNEFFFHYGDSPLLVINTSDIDFVENEEDLENLVGVIRKMRRGTHHYIPISSRRA